MSKKNKKKFKRNKSHSAVALAPVAQETVNNTSESTDTATADSTQTHATVKAEKSVIEDPYNTDQYRHVQKDVKKILFIIFILALVFVAVWIIGSKTGALSSFGNWIYKIANIQTG